MEASSWKFSLQSCTSVIVGRQLDPCLPAAYLSHEASRKVKLQPLPPKGATFYNWAQQKILKTTAENCSETTKAHQLRWRSNLSQPTQMFLTWSGQVLNSRWKLQATLWASMWNPSSLTGMNHFAWVSESRARIGTDMRQASLFSEEIEEMRSWNIHQERRSGCHFRICMIFGRLRMLWLLRLLSNLVALLGVLRGVIAADNEESSKRYIGSLQEEIMKKQSMILFPANITFVLLQSPPPRRRHLFGCFYCLEIQVDNPPPRFTILH